MPRRTDRGALARVAVAVAVALAVTFVGIACDPKLADRFLCGPGGACPDGLVCAFDGICRAPSPDNVRDAAVALDLVSLDMTQMSLPDQAALSDLAPPSIDASNLDLAGCMAVKCDDKGERECGWTDDHCGSPLFCGFCQMGKMCGKKKANKCD